MKKTKDGFTIVEVLFSMFILFSFVMILTPIPKIMQNQMASADVTQATFLCQNKLEDIRVSRGKNITEGTSTETITIGDKKTPYMYEIEKKTWAQDPTFWEFVVSVKKFFGGQLVKRSYASMAYALPKEAFGEGECFLTIKGGSWQGIFYSDDYGANPLICGIRFNPSTNCIEACAFLSNMAVSSGSVTLLRNWTAINPPAPKPIKRLFIAEQNESPTHSEYTGYAAGLDCPSSIGHFYTPSGVSYNISDIVFIIQDTDNNLWTATTNFRALGVSNQNAGAGVISPGGYFHPPDYKKYVAAFNLYTRGLSGAPWVQVPGLKLR